MRSPKCRLSKLNKFSSSPRSFFETAVISRAFSANVNQYLGALLDPANTSYRPRDLMEEDPSFKQLIPYCIFEYEDENGLHLFQYTRGSGAGEARLRAKKSVGIGGHISTLDTDSECVYSQGLQRELDEELVIETEYDESCVGLINDDSNEVGQVHLGVVHRMRVATPEIRSRETEIAASGFEPLDSILDSMDGYETWSQICLKAIYQAS